MQETKLSFEETLGQLDTILAQMEDPEITLENSVEHYKKALTLITQAKEKIELLKLHAEALDKSAE
jgi:exodeoxyribonuclease VII small subunit